MSVLLNEFYIDEYTYKCKYSKDFKNTIYHYGLLKNKQMSSFVFSKSNLGPLLYLLS